MTVHIHSDPTHVDVRKNGSKRSQGDPSRATVAARIGSMAAVAVKDVIGGAGSHFC